MDIESRPELEDLVKYEVDGSAHQSPDKNVEHAVSLLQAHETWLGEHRAEHVEGQPYLGSGPSNTLGEDPSAKALEPV